MENGIIDMGLYLPPDQYYFYNSLSTYRRLAPFAKNAFNHRYSRTAYGNHA